MSKKKTESSIQKHRRSNSSAARIIIYHHYNFRACSSFAIRPRGALREVTGLSLLCSLCILFDMIFVNLRYHRENRVHVVFAFGQEAL